MAAPMVRIRDTGVGMTKEEIAVALTPFAQVDASHSRWREGAGLGLPIAKALVQLHGGRLEIRSAKISGNRGGGHCSPRASKCRSLHGRDVVLGSGGNRDALGGHHGTRDHAARCTRHDRRPVHAPMLRSAASSRSPAPRPS